MARRLVAVAVATAALLALCGLSAAATSVPRGVEPSLADKYTSTSFTCLDGSQSLPAARVNDDFCDCADGSDEPGTAACPQGRFWCANKDFRGVSIPSSRVNDGVCDCCDGSDEYTGIISCPDKCAAEAEAWRAAEEQRTRALNDGLAARARLVNEATEKLRGHRARLAELKTKQRELQERLDALQRERDAAEAAERDALAAYESQRKPATGSKSQSVELLTAAIETAVTKLGVLADAVNDGQREMNAIASEIRDIQYALRLAKDSPTAFGDAGNDDDDEGFLVDDDGTGSSGYPEAIVAAAVAARASYDEVRTSKQDVDAELSKLESLVSLNYGADDAYFALRGQCVTFDTLEYIYELCPFEKCEQRSKKGGSTNLGRWGEWDGPAAHLYKNGQRCWQGPDRSTRVHFVCGSENALLSVEEPAKCEYEFRFATPIACTPEQASAAAAKGGAAKRDEL